MATNVTFQKKNASEYQAIKASIAGPVKGRVYFVGNADDSAEVGEIYVDGKQYGGSGAGSNLSDAAASYYQQEYDKKQESDYKNQLTYTLTKNPSQNELFATREGSSRIVTYTLRVYWKGNLVDINVVDGDGKAVTSNNKLTWTRVSLGTYTISKGGDNIRNIPAETIGFSFKDNETGKTISKTGINVSGTRFYNPIIWGAFYGYPSSVLTTLPTFNSSGVADQSNNSFPNEYSFSLKKELSNVYSTVKDLSRVFTAHVNGAKFVILVPNDSLSASLPVTGYNQSTLTFGGPINSEVVFDKVDNLFNSNLGYSTFISRTNLGYTKDQSISLKIKSL